INKELINRLNNDAHSILLEGLHCAGILPFLNNSKRVVVRMHNEEASYYHHLSNAGTSFFKKNYFIRESKLLHLYQKQMNKEVKLACLSEADIDIFRSDFGFAKTAFIPCFIPWQAVSIKEGKGVYCLYHGKMSVPENEEAAIWLIQNVFNEVNIPFIIAGKGISKKLLIETRNHSHISVVNDPTISEINSLIQNAHINVLPSMNTTGVKLKLLNALLNGRYCLTNYNGIKGSKIHEGVMVKEQASEWIATIAAFMQKEFSDNDILVRKKILSLYDNRKNAQLLSALW
ncbi:MAG: glycosyltransferase, partial [Bacteroidota bacterium]|nr:glycosyltransferase [Bacteroidota bacterium]